MSFKSKFSNLGQPRKIWAIGAINGDLTRLLKMHRTLYDKFQVGDRLLYTGNYLCGENASPLKVIDELLYFRRSLLALPAAEPDDFVYLRGTQEELWNKLLQLQFMPSPRQVLEWTEKRYPMLATLLHAYGSSFKDAARMAREGVPSMTRWTTAMKSAVRGHDGHEKFFSVLRRAAFTENSTSNDNNVLFVHAGLDPQVPLMAQGDNFWWAFKQFNQMETTGYHPFKSVIRGFDPEGQGLKISPTAVTLDGEGILCAEMSATGEVLEILAA